MEELLPVVVKDLELLQRTIDETVKELPGTTAFPNLTVDSGQHI